MEASCAICRELFDAACSIATTKCGHVFHILCLSQWWERSTTCPQCRSDIREDEIVKLYFNTNFGELPSQEESLDLLKEKLHEKNVEISAKNKKIEELTAFVQQMREHNINLEVMLNTRNKLLQDAQIQSHELNVDNAFLRVDVDRLNNVKKVIQGSFSEANRILAEYVSSPNEKRASQRLAELCAVIKQQLCASIDLKDQLQRELTEFKSRYASNEGNSAQNERQWESQNSERLMDASSRSLGENVCFETNSTRECAPKDEIGLDSQIKKRKMQIVVSKRELPRIPAEVPQRSLLPPAQLVVSDRELPRIPTQVPQMSLLPPATVVAPSTPGNSVSRVGYNRLVSNVQSVSGNISQIPMQVSEVPNLCPTRFSLSLRPVTQEQDSRSSSRCLGHHGLKRPYSEN